MKSGKEMLAVVEAVSNERGVAEEIIFEALELALATATRKRTDEATAVRVSIDRETGEYETFRRWEIVDDDVFSDAAQAEAQMRAEEADEPFEPREFAPEREILLSEARKENPDAQAGVFVEEGMDSVDLGRIAAQTAKQVIVQKVREAERERVVEMFKERLGETVTGLVKRIDRGNVTVDLGDNAEALIPREEMIPKEAARPGDRIRGYLKEIRQEPRGPQLIISRTAPELMMKLFSIEVPEIGEGLIQIMGCARDPGSRAKLGVHSTVARIDPVGACVGMRGSRVQAVSNELHNERVDIITWDENPAQYVINAMAPAEVVSIVVDEENNSMDVAVQEEALSQAIGRGGQNVRLASQLTGWSLNVMSEEAAAEKSEAEVTRVATLFREHLTVDEETAQILAQEGFTGIEDIALVSAEELGEIEGFTEELVTELQSRAQTILLQREIATEGTATLDGEPADDLIHLDGMDEALAYAMAAKGIATREDLAEQAVDDLLEALEGEELDKDKAGALILEARKIWFEEAEANDSAGEDDAAQPAA